MRKVLHLNRESELMTKLALSFPVLLPKFSAPVENGLEPWDLLRLVDASAGWSEAEQLVVSFLATVWNCDEARLHVTPFNVGKAYEKWDSENWKAFAQWVQKLYTC